MDISAVLILIVIAIGIHIIWAFTKPKSNELDKAIREYCKPRPSVDTVQEVIHPYMPKKEVITTWFVEPRIAELEPSVAEQKIIDALSMYSVRWYREVCFNTLKNKKGNHFRFDFYIPKINTLIEYDGSKWHKGEEQVINDRIKTSFCKQQQITLIRWNRKDYYYIEDRVRSLLAPHSIKRKAGIS